jgi:hypothetical protein
MPSLFDNRIGIDAMRSISTSFRGDAKHRTRNLEIPGLRFAHPGMTAAADARPGMTRMLNGSAKTK